MAKLVYSLSNGIITMFSAGGRPVMGVDTPSPVVVPSVAALSKVPVSRVRFQSGGLLAVNGGILVPRGIYSGTVNFVWGSSDLPSRITIGPDENNPFDGSENIDTTGSYTVLFSVDTPTVVFALARQTSGSPVALTILLSVSRAN